MRAAFVTMATVLACCLLESGRGAKARQASQAASTTAPAKPSVLFCTPKGIANRPYLDLDWLREIHNMGFQPDYLDDISEFTWDRIRRYNVLVIYGAPAAGKGQKSFQFAKDGMRLKEYVELIERYLQAGGGVFAMIHTNNGDKWVRGLVEPWGARLPLENYVETDKKRIAPLPRMRGYEQLALVDTILPSAISDGVRRLWLPYGEHYNASWTGPIAVSKDWQVVVKGPGSSHTVPVNLSKSSIPPPPEPLIRPGGVKQPDLMAIRSYKNGRIFLAAQQPVFSIGQGTQWLFDRASLSKGLKGIPSDYERLILNAFRWLGRPSLKSGSVGGYRATAAALVAPNLRPGAKKKFEDWFWGLKERNLHRSIPASRVYRGLIGAQTAMTGGRGTVADYAAAARKAGLDFVIFCEQFDKQLTPEKLRELGEQCKKYSDETLLLLPGYTIDTNVGNHMFFSGPDLPWPREDILVGPRKNILKVQGRKGEPASFLHWAIYEHARYNKHMIGFYNFDDPRAMKPTDLKLSSALAIMFYRDGKLIEDRTEDYLAAAEGTLTGLPVSFNLVRSPEELIREARSSNALTYAQGRSLKTLNGESLRWNSQYCGMNVFPSSGPIIRAWPETDRRAATYGAEPFVVDSELMLSELHVTSKVGLAEIRVMNGRRLVRRFLPGGVKAFREVLHLPGNVQQNLVVIATDVQGHKAVSFTRRCGKPGSLYISFCGDHVNDCGRGLLARGMGMFRAHMFPEFRGGYTWDGGPKGLRPVVHLAGTTPVLESDLGIEGGGMNGVPILEFDDDQAVVVRSVMKEVYGPETTPVNSWLTYGPIDPSRLMAAVLRYTEYNRPVMGVMPTGWAAFATRTGASVANFSNTVTFKKDQTVKRLQLLTSNWNVSSPVTVMVGEAGSYKYKTYDLPAWKDPIRERIGPGRWFGFYSPKAYNNVLFINRGDPVIMRVVRNGPSWQLHVLADIGGKSVRAGETFHHELFSVNEAINVKDGGPERFVRVVKYLERPDGMKLIRGRRLAGAGFFDVKSEAPGKPAELKVTRPARPIGLTIPVRVSGLNPRWSAGLFQIVGHTTGYYTDGRNVYTSLGFDMDGNVYAALYPDRTPETHVVIGHPVVCDKPELFLEVMPRSKKGGGYQWRIAVNNPTNEPVTATFRAGMKLPGLEFTPRRLTIPGGGYVVLQRYDPSVAGPGHRKKATSPEALRLAPRGRMGPCEPCGS